VPGFRFRFASLRGKLPPVAEPFGLELPYLCDDLAGELKELAPLDNLTLLCVRTVMTDAGLKELSASKTLTFLDLGAAKVSGKGLGVLAAVPTLRGLDLDSVDVGDEGMKAVGGCKTLTYLELNHAKRVTQAGVKELTALANLASLSLRNEPVQDAWLKDLAPLKSLTSLNLTNTQVTDAGLKELAPLKNLTTLYLSVVGVAAKGVSELAPLKTSPTSICGTGASPMRCYTLSGRSGCCTP